VDRPHDVEDFGNIAWIIWRVTVPYPAFVGLGMDRSFKQGETATHLVEKRIDPMQAGLVVEPSLVIFIVVPRDR